MSFSTNCLSEISWGKNPADLLTKHLAAKVIYRHCDTLNLRWVEGRAETGPTLDFVESYAQS